MTLDDPREVAAVISVVAAVGGLIGNWFLLRARLDAQERRQHEHEERSDRESRDLRAHLERVVERSDARIEALATEQRRLGQQYGERLAIIEERYAQIFHSIGRIEALVRKQPP